MELLTYPTQVFAKVPYRSLTLAPLVLGTLAYAFWWLLYSRSKLPLPPGPQGSYPFVGVLYDLPKYTFLKTHEWAKTYGPIMHCQIGRSNVIFLNDPTTARDLLEKRSNIYSDRPPSVVGDIVSRGARSLLMPYDARWRGVRKLFASLLTPVKCDTIYNAWSEKEAIVACKEILDYPDDLKRNIQRYTMSVVLMITYGKRAIRRDPLLLDFEEAAKNFVEAFRPGAFIVEYVPWLLKLPKFMQPGVKTLERYRDMEDKYNMEKWLETKEFAAKHPERHTIVNEIKTLHEDPELKAELSDMQCAATAMEIVGVGTDTTAASILILINALLLYPECIKKAHEELDRVIGQDRYPTWADQDKLPYIRALIKEQHRWRTINPLSFSHYTLVEDEYNGYRIPKNSIIRTNAWAIHMDPARYPDPERFNPDRFINHNLSAAAYANSSNANARDHWSYGNGKRICVGMHLAERNLWNMVSRMLHTFNIEPKIKPDGTPEIPQLEDYMYGIVLLPPNFEANFTVRSEKIRSLLEREFVETAQMGKPDSWDA